MVQIKWVNLFEKNLCLYPMEIVKWRIGLARSCCRATVYDEKIVNSRMKSGGGRRGGLRRVSFVSG
jgi:hypothetical protein